MIGRIAPARAVAPIPPMAWVRNSRRFTSSRVSPPPYLMCSVGRRGRTLPAPEPRSESRPPAARPAPSPDGHCHASVRAGLPCWVSSSRMRSVHRLGKGFNSAEPDHGLLRDQGHKRRAYDAGVTATLMSAHGRSRSREIPRSAIGAWSPAMPPAHTQDLSSRPTAVIVRARPPSLLPRSLRTRRISPGWPVRRWRQLLGWGRIPGPAPAALGDPHIQQARCSAGPGGEATRDAGRVRSRRCWLPSDPGCTRVNAHAARYLKSIGDAVATARPLASRPLGQVRVSPSDGLDHGRRRRNSNTTPG